MKPGKWWLVRFARRNALSIALAFLPPLVMWAYFERPRSELTLTLVSEIPVVAIDPNLSGDIEVQYRGQPVASLAALEIEVKNSGNRPLEPQQFHEPLRVRLPGRIIGGPSLLRSAPDTILPEFASDNSDIKVAPILLNAGDVFAFRTLVADRQDKRFQLSASTRIVGGLQDHLDQTFC